MATTPLRLLILEDNEVDAELALHELRRAGYQPEWVRVDDETGFREHLRPELDLILADYYLPQFDARRALRILRERGLDIPCIIVSGAIGEDTAATVVRLGAVDYVLKDRLGRLGTAVQNALEQKQLRLREQKAAGELQASQRSYEDLVNTIDGLVWEQERWLREPGFWLSRVHPDDRTSAVSYWEAVVARRGSGESQYRMLAADGRTIWVRDHYSVLVDRDQAVTLRGVLVDISSMKRTEEFTRLTAVVAEAANRATHVAEAMQVGVDEICASLGWPVGHVFMVAGDRSSQLEDSGIWHLDDQARFAPLRAVTEAHAVRSGEGLLGQALASGRTTVVTDLDTIDRFRRRDAASAAGLRGAVAIPVRMGTDVVAVVEFFAYGDIGADPELIQTLDHVALQLGRVVERERARRALEHQATSDRLTDLPNRTLLRQRLAEALHTATRSRTDVTLLLMDLDNFKEINDSFGHQAGDAVLRQVGPRVRDQLRQGDTVARLGGDEFAALLPGAALDEAVRIAEAILGALEQPVAVEGQLVDVRASIGIAAFPLHGTDAEELLQRADVAMYLAKKSGSSYAVYSPAEDPYDAKRIVLMADLRLALERSELSVFYQPKVNLMEGRLVGLEALARWHHPQRGWVSPAEFIPLAERSGLIKRLTTCVLEHVLQDIRAWQRSGKAVPVAVNLSMRDLLDPEFVATLTQRLGSFGVDPHCLQLEITETALMAEPARVLDTMTRLQQLGIRFAIDDFGTGYSSLAYLQRLHVQELKIDQSLVGQMATDSGSATIVRAMVELGHSLGLDVVAEGVEHEATRRLLIACKCETAQGFLISPALPAEEIERWLSHPVWQPVGQADTEAA